jgi:hypothetical protein
MAAATGIDPNADAALRPVLYSLAAVYGVVAAHTAVKLARLHLATRTWTRQKLLHYLVLACAICAWERDEQRRADAGGAGVVRRGRPPAPANSACGRGLTLPRPPPPHRYPLTRPPNPPLLSPPASAAAPRPQSGSCSSSSSRCGTACTFTSA